MRKPKKTSSPRKPKSNNGGPKEAEALMLIARAVNRLADAVESMQPPAPPEVTPHEDVEVAEGAEE